MRQEDIYNNIALDSSKSTIDRKIELHILKEERSKELDQLKKKVRDKPKNSDLNFNIVLLVITLLLTKDIGLTIILFIILFFLKNLIFHLMNYRDDTAKHNKQRKKDLEIETTKIKNLIDIINQSEEKSQIDINLDSQIKNKVHFHDSEY